jgi:hypothetical protein
MTSDAGIKLGVTLTDQAGAQHASRRRVHGRGHQASAALRAQHREGQKGGYRCPRHTRNLPHELRGRNVVRHSCVPRVRETWNSRFHFAGPRSTRTPRCVVGLSTARNVGEWSAKPESRPRKEAAGARRRAVSPLHPSRPSGMGAFPKALSAGQGAPSIAQHFVAGPCATCLVSSRCAESR